MTQMVWTYPEQTRREQILREQNKKLHGIVRRQRMQVRLLAVLVIILAVIGTARVVISAAERARDAIGVTDARGRV